MSIALFSTMTSANGTPRRLKVFSIPFHVLPSTLPSPAPELPVLTHDHKKGVFASLMKSLSFSSTPRQTETGYHIVYPSLPTSHFSPGAHASIPVSLRIVDRPLEPTDLYIRLAIVRKTYVRESSSMSLANAIEDEWGLGTGVSLAAMGYPEEVIVEPWCKEEEEIVSRWGWVPYSSRPGADPTQKAEVVINDIALPLIGSDGMGWDHGYSTSLDLEPTSTPTLTHGECSWFSPSFRNRPPVQKEYGKHVHVFSILLIRRSRIRFSSIIRNSLCPRRRISRSRTPSTQHLHSTYFPSNVPVLRGFHLEPIPHPFFSLSNFGRNSTWFPPLPW